MPETPLPTESPPLSGPSTEEKTPSFAELIIFEKLTKEKLQGIKQTRAWARSTLTGTLFRWLMPRIMGDSFADASSSGNRGHVISPKDEENKIVPKKEQVTTIDGGEHKQRSVTNADLKGSI